MDTLLLYWFRTPPFVKVGRAALDREARERLELQYPDITFDWDRILREPPQTLTEQEAARRRDQRDARDARRRRKRPLETAEGAEESSFEAETAVPETGPSETAPETMEEDFLPADDVLTVDGGGEAAAAAPGNRADAAHEPATRRRRRRRRGKRRPGEPGGTPPAGAPPTDSV
jgi:hypothetical protein